MGQKFTYQRRVEFRDTDSAGIVHFSVFFAYMEAAEHELLRSVGLGVMMEIDGARISWPRVKAECNYRNAARFEEVIEIQVSVTRIGSKSVTYEFDVRRNETPIADGRITAVCCKFDHDVRLDTGKLESCEMPQIVIDALNPFLSDAQHN